MLQPVFVCPDPIRGGDDVLVMTEVQLTDFTPHPTNTRAACVAAAEKFAAQEPLFVPRSPDAPDGDGFILTAVDRFVDKRTDLLILDGNDVSRPPIATVKLPFALPMAFHGSWMAA